MILRRFLAWLIPLALLGPHGARAQGPPKVVSLFPLGGQRGTSVEAEVRGTGLEGAYAVWLGPGSRLDSAPGGHGKCTAGTDGLAAQITAIPDGSRANVRLVIAPDARAGFHSLGLISPRGLSGAASFWVGPDAALQGTAMPHATPETAQRVKLPLAVSDRISEGGQLNYYALDVAHEQKVAFEVLSLHGPHVEAHLALEPQLALYEAGGSFLDPRRPKRLLFHEEITQGGMPASRRLTYHFTRPGRYLLSFGNSLARGGAGSSYLLRMAPADEPAAAEDALSWAKRRLEEIRARAVGAPVVEPVVVSEAEPNDDPAQARAFALPAVLEGTIGRPGDIDHFRFRGRAGQKLALEVHTPQACPPHFNPRLDVVNARGTVVLSNLRVQDGKIGTVDAKVVQVNAQALGKLDEGGEYCLRVRDLTALRGGHDHKYRVLVRPQIPHVGDIRLQPEGPVNLVAGARQRLTLHAPGKEDYGGALALSVEGLPEGVRAFVGANGTTIDLVAQASAPCSVMPQVLRIWALPSVGEKSGSAFLVGERPVMVIRK
jgi:hypothetical protein